MFASVGDRLVVRSNHVDGPVRDGRTAGPAWLRKAGIGG